MYGTCEGAFAEYVSVPANLLAPKPANLTFEQAATVAITGTTALQAVRDKGGVKAGQQVMIIGAAGGVGSFAVQIATRPRGARDRRLQHHAARHHQIDRCGGRDRLHARRLRELGRRWDVIVETAGARPLADLRRALTQRGTLVIVGGEGGGKWVGKAGRMVQAPLMSPFISQTLRMLAVKHNGADLVVLKDLIEAGNVTPVVGRTYQLSEVPDAIRDLEQGRTQGKSVVVI